MVFDCVLGAPRDELGDVGPLVADALVGLNQQRLLSGLPGVALDVGPQLVVPPLPALLADAPSKVPRNQAPVALTVLPDQPVVYSGGSRDGAESEEARGLGRRAAACSGGRRLEGGWTRG